MKNLNIFFAVALFLSFFAALTPKPSFSHGHDWELAVRNPGDGGYNRAYSSLSDCKKHLNTDSYDYNGETCMGAINNCGSYGFKVFTTTDVVNDLVKEDVIDVHTMNGESVGNILCSTKVR